MIARTLAILFLGASLQAAASKQRGLEGLPRPPISLAAAPTSRLAYAHEAEQPQRPPHVAAFAVEAERTITQLYKVESSSSTRWVKVEV